MSRARALIGRQSAHGLAAATPLDQQGQEQDDVRREDDEEDISEAFPAMVLNLDGPKCGARHLKWIECFHWCYFTEPTTCPRHGWPVPRYRNRTDYISIRQNKAHQRHHSHSESDQQHSVFEGQDGNCLQSVAGNDCGREVVESSVILFGCDFHNTP